MSEKYDAIIVGAGHNGLVAAGYLAKAGLKTLVLERRKIVGGASATEEIAPGFWSNTGAADAGLLLPAIVEDLDLAAHGLSFLDAPVAALALNPDGDHLVIPNSIEEAQANISRHSARDGQHYPAFWTQLEEITTKLRDFITRAPPDLTEGSVPELMPWLKMGLNLRRSGGQELMDLIRILPLPFRDFLDDWFENDLLKGLLAVPATFGSAAGPFQAGTTLMYLYQNMGLSDASSVGYRSFQPVKGGVGRLSAALAAAAESCGAQIRTGTAAAQILLDQFQEAAVGVTTETGQQILAGAVLSSADPKTTFLNLVGSQALSQEFKHKISNIRLRGTTAKVNLLLSDLPRFNGIRDNRSLTGNIVLSPSMAYVERASDDAKYGRPAANPVLEMQIPTLLDPKLAPPGSHIMSITVRYVPYALKEGSWQDSRVVLGKLVVETLSHFAPDLPQLIIQKQVLTPVDFESIYGLAEGSIYHGQMGFDQLFLLRPVPGWANYRTPFKGLYLCGAGTHPGGGVTGIPGKNAANEVLKDRRQ